MTSILIAGATGRLGMRLVRRFRSDGYRVRVLVREPQRLGLLRHHVDEVVQGDLTSAVPANACDGVDIVFSCASASTRVLDAHNESSFESVNHYGNVGLLRAALRARVQRFLYVAPLGAERLTHTAYGGAHERFVATLHRSALSHTVIRPTAYFEHLEEGLLLLRAGHPWLMGAGSARTNPIHEADLADFCAGAVSVAAEELPVGGPVVLTRDALAELAQAALRRLSAGAARRRVGAALRLTNPRVRALLEFSAEISRLDVVGPAHGTRDLKRHLHALTGTRGTAAAAQELAAGTPHGPLLALSAEPVEWQALLNPAAAS